MIRSRSDLALQGALKARKVHTELGLVHPTEAPIEIIAQLRGLLIRYTRIEGAEARLLRTETRAVAAIARSNSVGRQRFSAAHELGHYELHRDHSRIRACSADDMHRWSGNEKREAEANWFAAELLMPAKLFEPMCDVAKVDLDIIRVLANEFQVSMTAAAIRFVTFTEERCCVVLSKDGAISWAWPSRSFGYEITPKSPLNPMTLAYDYFASGDNESAPQAVAARSWIEASTVDVIEHSIGSSLYGTVLSTIWIPS